MAIEEKARELLASCSSGDWMEIGEAGEALAGLGSEIVPFLIETLEQSESWYEIAGVANALELLAVVQAGPLLLRAFNAQYPELDEEDRGYARVDISSALGTIGYRAAIPSILQGLSEALTGDGYVARCLIRSLGELEAEEAIDAIVSAADHSDIDVRKTCMRALRTIVGTTKTVELLKAAPPAPGRSFILMWIEREHDLNPEIWRT